VLKAAFSLFVEQGFSSTSMLDIVTRARVSKRDLYALFNNKHAVLAAGISERAQQMRQPLDTTTPVPQTGDALAALLIELGVSILKTVCHPEVLTVFRLAIAESDRAPEIARTLNSRGHEANQKALTEVVRKAQARGLVRAGDPGGVAIANGQKTTQTDADLRPLHIHRCSYLRPESSPNWFQSVLQNFRVAF